MPSAFGYLFLLLFVEVYAKDLSREDTVTNFENDNLESIQKYEESARRMWDLSSRMRPTSEETEQEEAASSEKVELFTWFPWFEKNPPHFHTIKAVATLKNENSSKSRPALGVGSWHEITLFGKKREETSDEEPDAKALWRNSASIPSAAFKWISAALSCLMCLYLF